MALMKMSGDIIELRGSFGGVYFKKDNSGQHIQGALRHVKSHQGSHIDRFGEGPPGIPYDLYVKMFTLLAARWWILVAAQIILPWTRWANEQVLEKTHGHPERITNWMWFVHYNQMRQVHGLPPYPYPPKSQQIIPTYVSQGSKWPDDTMMFYNTGIWDGEPYYVDEQTKLVLFWHAGGWYIAQELIWPIVGDYYYHDGLDPEGDYIPTGGLEGILTITK
jgi:hypothetical protein